MIWPAETLERGRQMWVNGHTASQIGSVLGVSRNAVIGQAHRRGWGARAAASPLAGKRRRVRNLDYAFHLVEPSQTRRRRSPKRLVKTPELKPVKFIPRVDVVVPPSLNVALVDLEHRQCRWPYGDGPFLFCGHARFGHESYCEAHVRIAGGPVTESERSAIDGIAA